MRLGVGFAPEQQRPDQGLCLLNQMSRALEAALIAPGRD